MKMIFREKYGLTYSSTTATNYYETSGDFSLFAITDSDNILHNYKHKPHRAKTAFKIYSTNDVHLNRTTRKRSSPDKMPGVLPIITDMLRKMIRYGVSHEEIHNAKTYIRGKNRMNMENGIEPVEYNGIESLIGNKTEFTRYEDLYESKYANITHAQISRVIHTYFRPENMCISMVGGSLPGQKVVEKYCNNIFK